MTTDGQDTFDVPDVIAEALRAAAAAVPDADLHPTGPVLRLQERRRRRRITAGLGGIGAVAAVALAVLAVGPGPSDDEQVVTGTGTDATSTSSPPPAGAGGAPLLLPRAGAEWLPDGSVRPVPRAQPDDAPTEALRLADGRLVTLATRDLRPGVAREDGAFVEDLAVVLALFDADGSLVREEDVRRVGGYVDLAGEVDGKVVLARTQSLGNCCRRHDRVDFTVIDPATMTEESLVSVDGAHGPADTDADRLVAGTDPSRTGEAGPCRLYLVDLGEAAGAAGPPPSVRLPGCLGVRGVALSPEGDLAAVVAAVTDGDEALRPLGLALFVVDVAQGEVTATESLGDDPCTSDRREMCGPTEFRAVTWSDDTTVDVVVQDPDPVVDGTLDVGLLVPERLRTVTVPLDADQS